MTVHYTDEFQILLQALVAMVLGGLLGWEREVAVRLSPHSTTFSGNTVTVQLGHVNCDGSDITVSVAGVNGASSSVDASATMTLRVGDVNADGVRH